MFINIRDVINLARNNRSFTVDVNYNKYISHPVNPDDLNPDDVIIYINVHPRIGIGVGTIDMIWIDGGAEPTFTVDRWHGRKQGIAYSSSLEIKQQQILGKLVNVLHSSEIA